MALKRCAACGAPITREDARSGRALNEQGRWYCIDCSDLIRDPSSPSAGMAAAPEPDADGAPDDATVELSIHPVQARLKAARKEQRERSRKTASGGHSRAFYVGVIVVAVALVVLALVVLWGR